MTIQETCLGGQGLCKLKSVISCGDLDDGEFFQASVSVLEAPKFGVLYDAAKFDLLCEGLKRKKRDVFKRALPSTRMKVRDLSDKLEHEFSKNHVGHVICDELDYKQMRAIVFGLLDELRFDERTYEEFARFTA